MLTGRCEAWLVGELGPFHVALGRLTAYADAGADCLYAPGVTDPVEIATLVKEVSPKPVNVLVSAPSKVLTVSRQLHEMGVSVSVVPRSLHGTSRSGLSCSPS